MAKILFTAVVADMRRKVRGSVFTKNRYGAMIRTKVTPRNPKTEAQSTTRHIFSANSAGWRTLTDIQRKAWAAFAATISSFDVFRVARVLTGQVAYVKLNTLLHSAGLPGITDPPVDNVIDSPFVINPVEVDFTDEGITGVFVGINSPQGSLTLQGGQYLILVDATQQLSAGIMTRTHGFTRIFNPVNANAPFDISAPYMAKYGAFIPGRKIFLRLRALHSATGAVSIPIFTSFIIPDGNNEP